LKASLINAFQQTTGSNDSKDLFINKQTFKVLNVFKQRKAE